MVDIGIELGVFGYDEFEIIRSLLCFCYVKLDIIMMLCIVLFKVYKDLIVN